MDGIRVGVALVGGAIVGAWIAWQIRSGTDRRGDADLTRPVRTFWLAPAVAVACAWVTWRLGADPWPVLLLWLPLVPLLASLAAVDLDERRLPDRILIPAAAWTMACIGLLGIQQHSLTRLLAAAVAGVLCGASFWALHLVSRGALGFGDAKLAAVAWQSLVWALLGACALGLVWAAVTRRREIAFGPWLALGAVVAVGLPH